MNRNFLLLLLCILIKHCTVYVYCIFKKKTLVEKDFNCITVHCTSFLFLLKLNLLLETGYPTSILFNSFKIVWMIRYEKVKKKFPQTPFSDITKASNS